MRLWEKLPCRQVVVALALCFVAALVWWFTTKPVLFHSHILATADDRLCSEYNGKGTGLPILNPFRSRRPERIADVFLRAASSAECLPSWNEKLCKYITERRPLPAGAWRLVNRWDSAKTILLYYKLESHEQTRGKACVIAEIELQRTGGTWEIRTFGLTPAHFCPG